MQQITVQPEFGNQLGELDGQAVLCDANGRALGFFSPLTGKINADDLQLTPPLSIAETEELRKVKTGMPLEEILHRLGL